MARDFLFEIGTEELPASACRTAIELVPAQFAGMLAGAAVDVPEDAVKVYASPRRIALLVKDVPEGQAPRESVQRGPAADVAFAEDGSPTQAAEGFARAKGASVDDLEVREAGGRRFVCLVTTSEARPTVELLPELCARLVRDLYFSKNMRWGPKDVRFSRPVRWLLALWGEDVVPVEVAGLSADRVTYGHRWLGGRAEISSPGDYLEGLRSVRVVADHEERERLIREEVDSLAGDLGFDVIDPMDKLAEVVFLVEWPTTLSGTFGEDHLRLPEEVLITAMQSHQRYFPLVDTEGTLSNRFLFVMNGDPAHSEKITAGNEQVLEGRIEDAEFSFDKDLAMGVEEMARGLDKVVFHEKIGTMRDKTDRLGALVEYLAGVTGADGEVLQKAAEAARLAKADQVSVMVREFADLEGVMGEHYTRREGYPDEVARAIREQFLPDAAGGELPRTLPGALLATAEKADNVVAAYACGEPPTGSKDPYGLRRAATGMVNIAFMHGLHYDVRALLEQAYSHLERFEGLVSLEQVVKDAQTFILERLSRVLVDNGIARDSVAAVLSTSGDFLDLRSRAVSLESMRVSARWEDLEVAFTRPANLARKLPDEEEPVGPDPALFRADAEQALYEAWRDASARVDASTQNADYVAALEAMADLRPDIDRYFDDVLVMDDDEDVRTNRLRHLAAIAGLIRRVAHLDRLQG